MQLGWNNKTLRGLIAVSIAVLTSCTKKQGCDGPAIDESRILALRRSVQSSSGSGPAGFLVVPNPIDATNINSVQASDPRVDNAGGLLSLQNLSAITRLENPFVKVRIKTIQDDVNTLAKPDNKSQFNFEITDTHYSEVMAYYTVTQMIRYVEALGFPVVKTRPLYVMVRAQQPEGSPANEPNAIYDHNYLAPNSPRTMRLFGGGNFAPGMDAEMYRHEFGHLFNESVSRESGIDFAGDNGAIYTEASALHECLADYLALSYGNKPTIGKWLARNLDGYRPGEPLRSMVDTATGQKLRFADVGVADGRGIKPERYAVAEWCGRVLWTIRQTFVDRDSRLGAVLSDRVVFSALSRLKKDTSISNFVRELVNADETLHCGGHKEEIMSAFSDRGFVLTPTPLEQPLGLTARAQIFAPNSTKAASSAVAGSSVGFDLRISNNNRSVARNVRVRLDVKGDGFYTTQYQQGYGDLPAGATLTIGNGGGLGYEFSVGGEVDKNFKKGARIRFVIRVLTENGQGASQEGEFSL